MNLEPNIILTIVFIVFSGLLAGLLGASHFFVKSLETRIKDAYELAKDNIESREKFEEKINMQFDKYAQCISELNEIKAQLSKADDLKIFTDNKTSNVFSAEFLGIWPEYDGETYAELDQYSEIKRLSETTFAFTKLDGNHATREAIVNELTLNPSINVIQIGAHGNDNAIILSPNNGAKYDTVPYDWFAKVLQRYDIKLVLLFVCTSSRLADMLYRSGVECVLGFREDVSDEQIIKFLGNFYKFLTNEKSVSESMRLSLLSFNNNISGSIVLRGDYTFKGF